MLKAGSLFYALILMLLIGVVLSVLILTSGTDRLIKTKLALQNELIDFNESSIAYALSNFSELDTAKVTVNPFNDSFGFQLKKEKWGFLNVLYSKTYLKKDTIKKTAFIGNTTKSKFALYLADFDKPLYLLNTKIKGDCKIPDGSYSKLHINNQTINKNDVLGNLGKSKKELPLMDNTFNLNYDNHVKLDFEAIRNSNLINKFSDITKIIYLNKTNNLENITISGKYVIKSFDSICIKRTAKLDNVIIQSPIIFIEQGFKGSLQLFASKKVIINRNVVLENPSFIHLKNEIKNQDTTINIAENSTLQGGVLLYGKTEDINTNYLNINENATVIGTIYCKGKTELKGQIYGTIYTDRFELDTGDAQYNNAIKNGLIDAINLPNDFVRINLLKENNSNFEILKNL